MTAEVCDPLEVGTTGAVVGFVVGTAEGIMAATGLVQALRIVPMIASQKSN